MMESTYIEWARDKNAARNAGASFIGKIESPQYALVVAKGIVVHPDYAWVNEDMLVHRHPLPQEDWSCADMTFFETHAGGTVFAVGSMTYVGSLMVAGGDTALGRLTANVVRRFADPAPFALPD